MRFGSVLISAVVLACVVFAYGGACLGQEPAGSGGGRLDAAPSALTLQGVLSVGGRSLAIINKGFYRKGDAVGGIGVAAMDPERVLPKRGARKIFPAVGGDSMRRLPRLLLLVAAFTALPAAWTAAAGPDGQKPLVSLEVQEMEFVVGKFKLNYLNASDSLVSAVEKLLSPRGSVSRLRETNSLVVKGIPVSVRRVEDFLLDIDRRPGQILIETRIVEVNSGYMKELGINWQASYGYKSSDVMGGLGSVESSAGVNLPPSVEEGLSLGFGLVSDKLTLDIRLSALEDRGKAKVVSTPSVMVLDNHTAVISDGTELLVPSMDATTVIKTGDSHGDLPYRAEIFRAVLELAVTPRVIDSGLLALFINTKREEFNFEHEVQGYPPKITKSLRTELIVRDGDTVAIGGIKTENERDSQSGVPLLSKIPLLGWLFKKETKSEDRAELLIFLTPKIMD